MERKKAMEQLFSELVETGAEFSYDDGAVTVGDITFTCREDYIVVSMGPVTNYFRYKTLCYISAEGNELCIADSHVGVFGIYKVGREMCLIDETERWEDDDDDDELMEAFLAADIEALS
jgi:hypothetical protein